MQRFSFLTILVAAMLAGCTSPSDRPIVVDPTVVQTSYDYVRPTSVPADQQKPVYILPRTLASWEAAHVDDKTGRWLGGRYVADEIEKGHWGTLEEAELSGKPYIVAGEDQPVIPVPSTPPGTAKGKDLDISALEIVGTEERAFHDAGRSGEAGGCDVRHRETGCRGSVCSRNRGKRGCGECESTGHQPGR